MTSVRATSIVFAIAVAFGMVLAAGPAKADWDHDGWRHHGWHHHGWWHWAPRAVIVAPRPYYYPRYYSPPVVYAPPPVYYAPPPPTYYAPGVSFGVTIH